MEKLTREQVDAEVARLKASIDLANNAINIPVQVRAEFIRGVQVMLDHYQNILDNWTEGMTLVEI